jgi:hypothetical protein
MIRGCRPGVRQAYHLSGSLRSDRGCSHILILLAGVVGGGWGRSHGPGIDTLRFCFVFEIISSSRSFFWGQNIQQQIYKYKFRSTGTLSAGRSQRELLLAISKAVCKSVQPKQRSLRALTRSPIFFAFDRQSNTGNANRNTRKTRTNGSPEPL